MDDSDSIDVRFADMVVSQDMIVGDSDWYRAFTYRLTDRHRRGRARGGLADLLDALHDEQSA